MNKDNIIEEISKHRFKKEKPSSSAAYNCLDVDEYIDKIIGVIEELKADLNVVKNKYEDRNNVIEEAKKIIANKNNEIERLEKELNQYKKAGYTIDRNK